METTSAILYYPAHARAEALRMAVRYEGCLAYLRRAGRVKTSFSQQKLRVVVPDAPINNAFVATMSPGSEAFATVPARTTADVLAILGVPPDPSFIGCHELTHWVQGLQVHGLPGAIDEVFGEVFTPQIGLDPWFWEGLAVYFETRLGGGAGRLGSPVWRGMFSAGVAGRSIDGGWMHQLQREQPYGAEYLTGSHFVDWLVETHGEEKLWDVVFRQGDSMFFPLTINPRFGNAYGRSLSELIDDFSDATRRRNPPRARGPEQRTVDRLDMYARHTCHASGSAARVTSGPDHPTRLSLRGPGGDLVFDRELTDILPGRRLATPQTELTSGLSFTADGRHLWFVALDQGDVQQAARLVHVDLDGARLEIAFPDLEGSGGSIDAAGRRYYFSRARGDQAEIAVMDLETMTPRSLVSLGPRRYALQPRISPDGARVSATVYDGKAFRLALFDAQHGAWLGDVPRPDGAADATWELDASWVDDTHLAYAAEHAGRMQIFVADLDARTTEPRTSAPYLALAPCVTGDRLRFLNREGFAWTLDEVPLAPTAITPRSALSPSHARRAADTARGPADHPVTVVADAPYSRLDRLFHPQLRGFTSGTVAFGPVVGLGAMGGDRLGFHRWAVSAEYSYSAGRPSGGAEWLTAELAPWFLTASAQVKQTRERGRGPTNESIDQRETAAGIAALRPFFTHLATIGARYDEVWRADAAVVRAAGPEVAVTYRGRESVPYAGQRRLLSMTARGAWFPPVDRERERHLADAGVDATVVLPLVGLDRPTLAFGARARAVLGARDEDRYLQVGGGGLTGRSAEAPARSDLVRTPPLVRFFEPLTGYEDLALFAPRVGILDARLRVPVILDVGTASTLWAFPAFFLRQIDLDVFGTGATFYDRTALPLAGGAGLVAEMAISRAPISLRLHVSRRFTYGPAWVPYLGGEAAF